LAAEMKLSIPGDYHLNYFTPGSMSLFILMIRSFTRGYSTSFRQVTILL